MFPTRYWTKIDSVRVQCDLCPRACRMREGQRGLCFVRMHRDGAVVLDTYGRSSGFCIDPIEKKPLHHFYPGSSVLSFGTAGCNLTCSFCQNWVISKSRETDRLTDIAPPEAIADAAHRHGCHSVAYTYNDPVIFHEYAIDTALACRELGVRSVAVTAGYISEKPREEFFRHMDAANVDLKAFTERFYHNLCGGHLAPVKETLVYIKRHTPVWLEITTLLIPGENDAEQEIEELTQWVCAELGPDVPLHFTAFHPDHWLRDLRPTLPSTLQRARDIAMRNGLRYVYTGNVRDATGGGTSCHQCGALLIGRDWYEITQWGLDDRGACRQCGAPCAGRFDAHPGSWGARRETVRIG
jgi:pyruvate formate lyase activating enzyme